MVQRVITLPNGRQCGLGVYVDAWRQLKAAPADANVRGFDYFPERADHVLRELRRGMHDRINRHVPSYGKGRKWTSDWFFAAYRLRHAVNTPRLIVREREVPVEFRAKLAHRVSTPDDF